MENIIKEYQKQYQEWLDNKPTLPLELQQVKERRKELLLKKSSNVKDREELKRLDKIFSQIPFGQDDNILRAINILNSVIKRDE